MPHLSFIAYLKQHSIPCTHFEGTPSLRLFWRMKMIKTTSKGALSKEDENFTYALAPF